MKGKLNDTQLPKICFVLFCFVFAWEKQFISRLNLYMVQMIYSLSKHFGKNKCVPTVWYTQFSWFSRLLPHLFKNIFLKSKVVSKTWNFLKSIHWKGRHPCLSASSLM